VTGGTIELRGQPSTDDRIEQRLHHPCFLERRARQDRGEFLVEQRGACESGPLFFSFFRRILLFTESLPP